MVVSCICGRAKFIWFCRFQIFIIIFQILFSQSAEAQSKRTWIWRIGNKQLDFHTNPPTITDVASPFQGKFGSLALADSLGNYQLFASSQNNSLYNKSNQLIKGSANQVTTNTSIFIPKPGSQNLVYYITQVKYWLIDTQRDTLIENNITWSNTARDTVFNYAVQHANCHDVWLISQRPEGFYSYLVNDNGISSQTVFSPISCIFAAAYARASFSSTGRYFAALSQTKLRPSAFNLTLDTVQINFGSFNRQNGQLQTTKALVLPNYSVAFASAFSQDETKLYLFLFNSKLFVHHLIQINIINGVPDIGNYTVLSTQNKLGAPFYSSMQLGPDGRIYHVYYIGQKKLNIIQNPNALGVNCIYQENAIPLSTSSNSIPAFIDTWFSKTCFSLDVVVNNNCYPASTTFSVINADNPQTFAWDFGDGQSSSAVNPSHSYASAGTYQVSLTLGFSGGQQQTINKTVQVFPIPAKPAINITLPPAK